MKVEIIRISQLEPGDKFMKFGTWREVLGIIDGEMYFKNMHTGIKGHTSANSKEFVQSEKAKQTT